ncbi:MAG: nitroreductase family protein [Actinobacteria bacterium]|nr:nitroreductase family protein [Actinomycetota bacterium]
MKEVIKYRRSIRKFSDRKIDQADLFAILEAARLAPSAQNSQPWHFIVVQDEKMIREIANCVPVGFVRLNSWMGKAAAIIVCCSKPKIFTHRMAKIFVRDLHLIDLTIAIENMVLAATDLGIGSCWVGWFSEKKVKKLLEIPGGYDVGMLLPLGYPERESNEVGLGGVPPRKRKLLEEIFSYEIFGKK